MATLYGYSRRTSEYREHWYSYIAWAPVAMIAGTVLALGVLTWLIVLGVQEQERWEQWCFDQGGRVDSTSQWIPQTTYDSKGMPHTTTSVHYTYYCLTEDGRLLDVKG